MMQRSQFAAAETILRDCLEILSGVIHLYILCLPTLALDDIFISILYITTYFAFLYFALYPAVPLVFSVQAIPYPIAWRWQPASTAWRCVCMRKSYNQRHFPYLSSVLLPGGCGVFRFQFEFSHPIPKIVLPMCLSQPRKMTS